MSTYKPERYAKNRERMLAASKEWRARNPEKVRAIHRAWVEKNRDHVNAQNRARYAADPAQQQAQKRAKKYGLTPEMLAEYLDAQEGACGLCGEQLDARFSVDHDHATGEVRGLVHQGCNVFLGMYEKYADHAKGYLEMWEAPRGN